MAAWNATFDKTVPDIWSVCSLLLPEDDVLQKMSKHGGVPIVFPCYYDWKQAVVNDDSCTDGDDDDDSGGGDDDDDVIVESDGEGGWADCSDVDYEIGDD